MKNFTLSLALLSVGLLSYDSPAQEPGTRPGGQRGQAEKGANRGPERQRRGGLAAERDPAQMVARLMQEFDKDGDQKLDSKELTAMMISLRDRRGGAVRDGAQGRPAQGRPGQSRRRPGAEGQQRDRGSDAAGNPGGEKPTRPEAE